MAHVSVKKIIREDVQTVWKYVSDWGGTSRWIPGVGRVSTEGAGVGATRSAELAVETGFPGRITERLDALDEDSYCFTYSTVGDTPLPVSSYSAELKVEKHPEGCVVIWSSDWEPEEVSEEDLITAFEQLYTLSLENVERELAGN